MYMYMYTYLPVFLKHVDADLALVRYVGVEDTSGEIALGGDAGEFGTDDQFHAEQTSLVGRAHRAVNLCLDICQIILVDDRLLCA